MPCHGDFSLNLHLVYVEVMVGSYHRDLRWGLRLATARTSIQSILVVLTPFRSGSSCCRGPAYWHGYIRYVS
jgi:hypothetical protein